MWALVSVLAAGLAIPVLRTQLRPEPERAPPPPSRTQVTPDLGRADPPLVYDVDFAGPGHGFALWGRCTNGENYLCERKLLVTEDGVNWTSRHFPLAAVKAPYTLGGRVVGLGLGKIILLDLDPSGSRLHRRDAGQTWRSVPAIPQHTVTEIPVGGVLETQCVELAGHPIECPAGTVAVIDPESGDSAWLATPPALAEATPEPLAADDGSWWVSGKDPSTGGWAVAVSRDAGRTWSVSTLPTVSGPPPGRLSVAARGPTVYVTATGHLPDGLERRSLVGIFLSTDGGRSWEQTWRAEGGSPRGLGGDPAVTPDGGLFIATDDVGPCYRSVDGGRTFTALLDGPRLERIRRTRAGYLGVASGSAQHRYLTSADGVRWTDVAFP
jgi:hypothetical protein